MNRRLRGTRRYALLGVAAFVATAAPVYAAPVAPRAEQPEAIGLLEQNFDVSADGAIGLRLRVPSSALADERARIVVTAHRPLVSRDAVDEARNGDLTRVADTVQFALAEQLRTGTDIVSLRVPVERSTRTADALRLSAPGLYPIVIGVRSGGETVANVTTFVHRLPDADEPDEQPMLVAIAVGTRHPVRYDVATGDADVSSAAIAELSALTDTLEATAVPVTVRLSPATASTLRSVDATLAERLGAALDGHELLAVPEWPLDPSEATAVDRDDLYRQWLRDGEDVLTSLSGTTASRIAAVADRPLSTGGAALLRDSGARLLLLPSDDFDGLPNSLGAFADTTQLVQLAVGTDTTIDAAVVDRHLDDRLALDPAEPLLSAIQIVAELVAARQEIEEGGGIPGRHGVVLATPAIGVIPAALLAPLTELLSTTSALEPVSLEELSVREDRLLVDGSEVVITLPDTVATSIADRVQLADQLSVESSATSSMFQPGDPRPARWQRTISLLATRAVSETEVVDLGAQMRSELAAVRNAIVLPDGAAFNLTGRTTEVPIKLFNNADEPLTVLIRLSSTKLLFPEGPVTVTLAPGEYTEEMVPIEVRSNGTFGVTLEVLTPSGDLRLAPPVDLTASLTALSGLGNLFTGALLLVLLTWWARHLRQQHRRRVSERHPSTGPAPA